MACVTKRRPPPAALLPQVAADLATAVDEAPAWTLDQAVGLVFGGLLLLLYLSSTQVGVVRVTSRWALRTCKAVADRCVVLLIGAQVDRFVARQQRQQLGLCEECGGVFEPGSCTEKSCPARQP